MFKSLFSSFNPWILLDGSVLNMGLNLAEWVVLLLSIAALIDISAMHEKGIAIRATLARQSVWLRWSVYIVGIFSVLILGTYGPDMNSAAFIYFQF